MKLHIHFPWSVLKIPPNPARPGFPLACTSVFFGPKDGPFSSTLSLLHIPAIIPFNGVFASRLGSDPIEKWFYSNTIGIDGGQFLVRFLSGGGGVVAVLMDGLLLVVFVCRIPAGGLSEISFGRGTGSSSSLAGRGKSGLVALNLDLAEVAVLVKERLGKEVEMGGCKGPITTFIVEPFVPHNEEFYLNIVSEQLGCSVSFSEWGGIEIEETGTTHYHDVCSSIQINGEIEFIKQVSALFSDLDFTFMEMNPFMLVNGKPCPLDMRGELDDTAAFKNFEK
ncbi:hypothetical protein RHMOL_Rhmol06G0162500 [Rhododendron molle]|uniref:Uncharacterized protein n=1 Tax=Rhododendron molle TaxID=49168 RepID=A0ACC0NCU2_RHOML|nr:hypothetical protein RHMOL_Rhmol06G0162500 [Rhododendron molle]